MPIDEDHSFLRGIWIGRYGSISNQYLSLESDFNVLYGLNGAGKTQILDCVKKTILKDDSFGEGDFGVWATSCASLVYEIADDSKEAFSGEFDQYTRMWNQPTGSGELPGKFQVLAALGVSEDIPLAQRSEILSDRSGGFNRDWPGIKTGRKMLQESIDGGLLVLVPTPSRNAFQIIYALSLYNDSPLFHAEWKKVFAATHKAGQDLEEFGVSDSPLVNAFTLARTITDRGAWDSYLQSGHAGEPAEWPLPFVPVATIGFTQECPTVLLTESTEAGLDELNKLTILYMAICEPISIGQSNIPEYLGDWEEHQKYLKSFANEWAAKLTEDVNRMYQSMLDNAPKLTFDLKLEEGYRLFYSNPPAWRLGNGGLSNVQQRWAKYAIRLCLESVVNLSTGRMLVILDEPENGFHRAAEQNFASALYAINHITVKTLIATHSPSFLDNLNSSISHVEMIAKETDSLSPHLSTKINNIPELELQNATRLGLRPSDLLQMTRVFWLVEGEHEVAVFNELFGTEMRDNRITLIPFRGVNSLASVADSRLLFDYTSASVLITLDNLQSERILPAWETAKQRIIKKQDLIRTLHDLTKAIDTKSGEGRNLVELLTRAIATGTWERIELTPIGKKDIIEYFDPKNFGLEEDWTELRNQFAEVKTKSNFKEFLHDHKRAKISIKLLALAAENLDEIDQDFIRCINVAIELSTRNPRLSF